MGNESNCYALNRNGVKGRNVLALTDEKLITKYQIFCTAEVYIESAVFDAPYVGPHSLPRPLLKIEGRVGKFKLEAPDLVFPSGTKNITLMPNEEEHVTVYYRLSDAEISGLAARGLFCNFEDRGEGYHAPANMVNNVMDIPMNVVYYGIQNEPITLLEVIKPDEIPTETRLNTYYGIFDLAPYEEKVIHELEGKIYPYGLGEPVVALPEADFIIKQREAEARLESQREAAAMEQSYQHNETETVEEIADIKDLPDVHPEDKDITDKINTSIINAASRDEAIHTNKAGFDAKSVVAAVNAEHDAIRAQAEFELESRNGVNYDMQVNKQDTVKAKPNTISDRMELLRKMTENNDSANGEFTNENQGNPYEMLSNSTGMVDDKATSAVEFANEQTEDANKAIRRVDVAMDNKALNEGNTDIAGHGASDNTDSSSSEQGIGFDDVSSLLGGLIPGLGGDAAVSASDVREAQAAKQRQISRMTDVAMDNQALNEGITDIAGHGAVVKPETDRSKDADLLSPSSGAAPSSPDQRFL